MGGASASTRFSPWVACGLVTIGVLARLLPHPPNLTPTIALALFAGAACTSRSTLLIPLATMVFSDLLLGVHPVIPFTWGGLALAWAFGRWVGRQPRAGRIALATLGSSTGFFLLSNFGVWLIGHGTEAYPKTLAGLAQCYVMALPFYRTALIGDLVYSAALFALWAYAPAPRPATTPVTSDRRT